VGDSRNKIGISLLKIPLLKPIMVDFLGGSNYFGENVGYIKGMASLRGDRLLDGSFYR